MPAVPRQRVAGICAATIGHATQLVQAAVLKYSYRPCLVEPRGTAGLGRAKASDGTGHRTGRFAPIDAVLLSHNHYDHLDLATLGRLHVHYSPLMAIPLGNDVIVRRAILGAPVLCGDWHDRLDVASNASTTLTHACHWSARGVSDRRMALWAGHWIETAAGSIWFAGDTGYGDGAIFREIRARHGRPDVALIPIRDAPCAILAHAREEAGIAQQRFRAGWRVSHTISHLLGPSRSPSRPRAGRRDLDAGIDIRRGGCHGSGL